MTELTGQRFGKYEVRERLGRGGMADVYKAYQPGMDRFVALKVLHGHLAEADDFIERFRREAQSVGQLRHPHILNVIDFDVENNAYYMVMEFISGGTLKDYIQLQNRLSPFEAVRIATQIADALSYAHGRGMVHRDIKPANIMFIDQTRQNAVLTDFGIARILDASKLTMSGMTVGTPAYMSPEAGKGEPQDERSDLYSLGIVLYEMLSGSVPFSADTPYAIIVKHIQEPLPALRALPQDLERILLKSTAKDPQERFQSAQELRDQLLTLQTTLSSTMPLAAGETSATYADELPTTIGGAPETDSHTVLTPPPIKPAPPARPWRYALGIVGVLVVCFSIFVAITNEGTPENKETTRPPTEAVTLEPTAIVTTEAPPEMEETPDTELELVNFEALSPEAQTCFSQGQAALDQNEFEVAVQAFTCVIELAPNFVPAYLQRASSYSYFDGDAALADLGTAIALSPDDPEIYNMRAGLHRSMENLNEALADLDRAIELGDDDSPFSFAARGEIHLWQGNYEQAIADFEQALSMNPDNGDFHLSLARVYLEMGQAAQALPYLEKAATFPNVNLADVNYAQGIAYRQLGDFEKALEAINQAIELQPEQAEFYVGLAEAYFDTENYPAGIEAFTQSIELGNNYSPYLYYTRGYAYLLTGNYETALEDINTAIEIDDRIGEFYAGRGDVYLRLGDTDQAAADYEQALELGYDQHPDMLYHLGEIYLLWDESSRAVDYLEEAVEIAPDQGKFWRGLGNALLADEEFEDAILAYQRALELGIDEPQDSIYIDLAYAYAQEEEYELALEAYNHALEINPDNASAYLGRGDVYVKMDEIDLALADYSIALEYDFDAKVYAYGNRGGLYLEEGDYLLAIEDLKAALELNNTIFYIWENLAYAYDEIGESEQALETFRQAVQVAENSGEPAPPTFLNRLQELEAEQ